MESHSSKWIPVEVYASDAELHPIRISAAQSHLFIWLYVKRSMLSPVTRPQTEHL
jgi:hypothetical protein